MPMSGLRCTILTDSKTGIGKARTVEPLSLAKKGLLAMPGQFTPSQAAFLRIWSLIPGQLSERCFFSGRSTDMFFQKAIQRMLRGPRPVRFEATSGGLAGCNFECATSHKYFLLGNTFELKMQEILGSLISSKDTVWDVGAHFGWWTLWFSSRCRSVVAFEPSPTNYTILQRNIESNDRKNVQTMHLAASSRRGTAMFVESGSYSHISEDTKISSGVEVSVDRLDNYLAGGPPSFVKVDVEGHAKSVLEGMTAVLADSKPRVACELHDATEDTAVSQTLRESRYDIEFLEEGTGYPKYILATPQASAQPQKPPAK